MQSNFYIESERRTSSSAFSTSLLVYCGIIAKACHTTILEVSSRQLEPISVYQLSNNSQHRANMVKPDTVPLPVVSLNIILT